LEEEKNFHVYTEEGSSLIRPREDSTFYAEKRSKEERNEALGKGESAGEKKKVSPKKAI